jgi:hypothetical protein
MPEFLRGFHNNIIQNYINKNRNLNSKENVKIASFGLNGQGFVFPVVIYPRVNVSQTSDFVIQAAILRKPDLRK